MQPFSHPILPYLDSYKKIALVGGGTGGHITPLIALRDLLSLTPDPCSALSSEVVAPQCSSSHLSPVGEGGNTRHTRTFLFIGEAGGMEEGIARQNSIPFFSVTSEKLRRDISLKTMLIPYKILKGIFQSIQILRREKPDLIFSKGSHVSIPVAIAGWMLAIPVFLHESDMIPGLANRIIARFSTRIFLGFGESRKYFGGVETIEVGQILNPVFYISTDEGRMTNDDCPPHLLVIAGSQGSTNIFQALLENFEKIISKYQITIILGKKNEHFRKEFEKEYKKSKNDTSRLTLVDFATPAELADIYRSSDIAITRASATTLAELDLFDIQKIIIPLPWSGNNHQYHNAKWYETHRGDILLEEKNMTELTGRL